jgi:predicted Fe-S protein YdhL (DUF1289 family)
MTDSPYRPLAAAVNELASKPSTAPPPVRLHPDWPAEVYRVDLRARPFCRACGRRVEHFFAWDRSADMQTVWRAYCHGDMQEIRAGWAEMKPTPEFMFEQEEPAR